MIQVAVTVSPIKDGNGIVTGASTIARSIEKFPAGQNPEKILNAMAGTIQDVASLIPHPFVAVDNDNVVIAWNRAMEEITKIPESAILGSKYSGEKISGNDPGRPLLMHLLDAGEEDLKKYYPGARREGVMITVPIDGLFPCPVNGSVWNRKASALIDSAGRRLGAYEMFCHVPADKKINAASTVENFFHPDFYPNMQWHSPEKIPETSEIKSRQIMNFPNIFNALKKTESGIVILDLSARCIWANDAVLSLLGNSDTIVGKSVAPFIAPEQRKPALDHLSNIRKHRDHAILPLSLLTSQGRVPVEASISLVSDD